MYKELCVDKTIRANDLLKFLLSRRFLMVSHAKPINSKVTSKNNCVSIEKWPRVSTMRIWQKIRHFFIFQGYIIKNPWNRCYVKLTLSNSEYITYIIIVGVILLYTMMKQKQKEHDIRRKQKQKLIRINNKATVAGENNK